LIKSGPASAKSEEQGIMLSTQLTSHFSLSNTLKSEDIDMLEDT